MIIGDQCLFGGEIVTIRGVHNHAVTGQVRFLVEHGDGAFSKVGAESLAPLETEAIVNLPTIAESMNQFFRAPVKGKKVLR